MAYRANSPLGRAEVRDRIIAAARSVSARGGRTSDLVRLVNGWPDVDGVTSGALQVAWRKWREFVPGLETYGALFRGGAYHGDAYGPATADLDHAQVIDVDVSEWDDEPTHPGGPPPIEWTEPSERGTSFLGNLAERMRDPEFAEHYRSADRSIHGQIKSLETWTLIPDCHVPYHDAAAFGLMLRASSACGIPNCVVLGDLADNYSVSSHDKSPARRNDLQWEVGEVNKALDQIDAVFPGRKIFIEGNHEDRLRRYLSTHARELYNCLSIEELFRLRERGWEHVPYKQHTRIGKLYLTHDAGKAGRYAHYGLLDTFQSNAVIGHTHRLGYIVEGNAKGRPHVAAQLGWLGDVERVDYMHRATALRFWAHAFGIAYRETATDYVHVVPVPIVNGRVVVEGKLIT